MNRLRIGIMGYSGQLFDVEKAKQNLNQAFDLIGLLTPPLFKIEVVSGLTYLGIPGIAYDLAVERGWDTIGIACAKAQDYRVFPCNKSIIVGKKWGQESPTFLRYCDIFIRVGGGNQTMDETAAAKAMGKKVLEFDLESLPKDTVSEKK